MTEIGRSPSVVGLHVMDKLQQRMQLGGGVVEATEELHFNAFSSEEDSSAFSEQALLLAQQLADQGAPVLGDEPSEGVAARTDFLA